MNRHFAEIPLLVGLALGAAAADLGAQGGQWRVEKVLRGPAGYGGEFGSALAAGQDLDGDGLPDFVVAARGLLQNGSMPGAAVALSGANAAELWLFLPPTGSGAAGAAVSFVPDLDGDGIADVLVGAPLSKSPAVGSTGAVFVLSGASGHLLNTVYGLSGGPSGEMFGSTLLGLADVDGDGAGDFAVGVPGAWEPTQQFLAAGRVDIYSGRSGTLLGRVWGAQEGEELGASLALYEDLTGDGTPELLAGSPGFMTSTQWPYPEEGSVALLDARHGRILDRLIGQLDEELGARVLAVPDFDGDGLPEIAAAGRGPDSSSSYYPRGTVTLFSSRTRRRLWQRTGDDGQRLGDQLALGTDSDGDGFAEIVTTRAWSYSAPSALLVLASSDGRVLWEIPFPKPYGSYQGGLAADFDLDVDGRPEIATSDWEFGGTTADGAVGLLRLDPWLRASDTILSAGAGGTVTYAVDFPDHAGGLGFALLGSLTGTGPTVLAGVALPLTEDGLLRRMLAGQAPPFLVGTPGVLDARGDATVLLQAPPGALATWIGRTFFGAALAYGPKPVLASAAVPLVIDP